MPVLTEVAVGSVAGQEDDIYGLVQSFLNDLIYIATTDADTGVKIASLQNRIAI